MFRIYKIKQYLNKAKCDTLNILNNSLHFLLSNFDNSKTLYA